MPLFGKKTPLTPEEQKARSDRNWQILGIVGDAFGDFSDNGGRLDKRIADQRAAAQRAELGDSFRGLLRKMKTDTYTPQVNELIEGANQRGAQVGMSPMQMQTPEAPRFDYTDPDTQDALVRYMMAGGNPQLPDSLTKSMAPAQPAWQIVRGDDGSIARVDPNSGQTDVLRQGQPKMQILPGGARLVLDGKVIQGAQYAPQRPPAARKTGSGAVGPVKNQPTRIVTY